MAGHVLQLSEGAPVGIPGTRFSLSVDTIRHRTAMAPGDQFARSMVTAVFSLWEGDRKLAEARGIDGQSFKLGAVQVSFRGQGDGPGSVLVDVGVAAAGRG